MAKIAITVTMEEDLVNDIDKLALAADLNRSQYLRKLSREAVDEARRDCPPLPILARNGRSPLKTRKIAKR